MIEPETLQINKKVHFASSPIIVKNVPWALEGGECCGDLEKLISENRGEIFDEMQQKIDFPYLRTPYNRDQPYSCAGIFFLIAVLVLLFSIIWWVAEKLLMIEVEEQVSNTVIKNYNI